MYDARPHPPPPARSLQRQRLTVSSLPTPHHHTLSLLTVTLPAARHVPITRHSIYFASITIIDNLLLVMAGGQKCCDCTAVAVGCVRHGTTVKRLTSDGNDGGMSKGR